MTGQEIANFSEADWERDDSLKAPPEEVPKGDKVPLRYKGEAFYEKPCERLLINRIHGLGPKL